MNLENIHAELERIMVSWSNDIAEGAAKDIHALLASIEIAMGVGTFMMEEEKNAPVAQSDSALPF